MDFSKPVLVASAIAASCCLLSCQSGPNVTLNSRIYNLPDMTIFGQACTYYALSDGSSSSSSAGGFGTSFTVQEQHAGSKVVVTVANDGQVLVQRNYDEAFFQSERVDEFTGVQFPIC